MSDWKKEKAELLAKQYIPVVGKKRHAYTKDLAHGIGAALQEAEERGRREENKGCHDALDYSDFIEYCKKLGQDPSGALVLAASQAYKYAQSTIRARLEKK